MTKLCSQPHAMYVSSCIVHCLLGPIISPVVEHSKEKAITERFSEPVVCLFAFGCITCLLLLCSALWYRATPKPTIPHSFALGLLISFSQWEALVGDCRWGGEKSKYCSSLLWVVSLVQAVFPWS